MIEKDIKLKKELYFNNLKAQKIFKINFPNIIKDLDKTNNRFFETSLFKKHQDKIYDKYFIVYDTLKGKFISKTINHFEIMPYETFNEEAANMICNKLNEELQFSSYDDIIFEHILNL